MNKCKSISEDSIVNKYNNIGKDFDFIWLKNFLNCNHRYSLKEIAIKLGVNNVSQTSQIW